MDMGSESRCGFPAAQDFGDDVQCSERSSLATRIEFMATENIGREILPQKPKSVCEAGREGLALSSQEIHIITHIVSGCTNQEMALHFCSSEATIYRRTLRIIEKLGVANKLELVLYALSQRVVNWFPGDPN